MSQWAEVRHLHLVEDVPKKEIARRLKLDVKTVRRAIGRPTPPVRVSPQRVRSLDPWRKQIEEWLHDDPQLTAKRVRRLLLPLARPVSQRTVRRYVAALKSEVKTKEAFVHRSALPGATMEVDFGETWVDLAGAPCKVKYLVATLPYSNAYFAKAYPIERLESLLDGIESAFLYFGGATARVVLDNTSLAVKEILAGRDRVQTEAFEAFRGAYPFRAEFCAPAKGWEKSLVEGGVKYARNLVFRPRLAIKSWAALNAAILTELEADLPLRHLDDGRPAQEALALERLHLRALPEHLPATCRVVARVADKFGHVRVDHVTYSVPIRHAYRPAWVKLYHDRVAIAVGAEVVAQHRRVFCRGAKVLDAFHVLPLLERKHRAVAEATALADWRLAPVWEQVRAETSVPAFTRADLQRAWSRDAVPLVDADDAVRLLAGNGASRRADDGTDGRRAFGPVRPEHAAAEFVNLKHGRGPIPAHVRETFDELSGRPRIDALVDALDGVLGPLEQETLPWLEETRRELASLRPGGGRRRPPLRRADSSPARRTRAACASRGCYARAASETAAETSPATSAALRQRVARPRSPTALDRRFGKRRRSTLPEQRHDHDGALPLLAENPAFAAGNSRRAGRLPVTSGNGRG